MLVRHSVQVTQADNPDRAVSRNAWNADHAIVVNGPGFDDWEAVEAATPDDVDAAAPALEKVLRLSAASGNMVSVSGGTLAHEPQAVEDIDGAVSVRVDAEIVNADGSAASEPVLLAGGDGTEKIRWRGGSFDAATGPHSCLEIKDWAVADVEIDEAFGITCSTGSTGSTSGLVFSNVDKGRAKWGRMHDMDDGTSTQGSVPRCFSVSRDDEGRSDVDVYVGECTDVHGVIVVGDIGGGVVNTFGGHCRNVADNGVYNVGDASEVNCHDILFDVIDEPFVNSGSGWINAFRPVVRNASNSIGLQGRDGNKPSIKISGGDLKFASGVNPFKTRGGSQANETAGALIVENTTIECTPVEKVFDLGSFGTIEDLIIRRSTIIINYSSSVATGTDDGFWSIGGTDFDNGRIEIDDVTFILRDLTGNIPDNLRVMFSVDTVSRRSFIKARFVNETANQTVRFGFNGARQQLIERCGMYATSNVSDDGSVAWVADTAAPGVSYSNAVPSAGYHAKGHRTINLDPDAGEASEWVCTIAGTPGTHEAVSRVKLQGAVGYTGEAISAGAFGTEATITVTGAAAGDFVESVATSVASVGEVWCGYVSAADTVKVRPQNITGSGINTTTGTVRARVQKL